ncbi:outer membrane protein transport protein [Vibrio sp. S4M6]|uniref:OmpP1/FadL family transporter n=1 Tax=Vibrio sinus TaxID=2946865 RepID=UPI00202ABB47|nr:outer membrane protein transport protein [Vibrio sinus]MCL9781327.1 outer membrane protein transport protein [Vibrio sinus]
MHHSRLYKKSILAVALGLASQHAMAAGFQLNAQSATGLGRAFAGDAVIADNASVMAKNPAAMALFKSSQFSTGVNVLNTSIRVKDVTFSGSSVEDAHNGEGTLVPNIYYVYRLDDTWAFGAGIYSNFGTKNDFPDNWGGAGAPTANQLGGVTEIKSINYALTTSYRLNEHLSFGAGLDIVHGSGKLQRNLGGSGTTELTNIDADGTGLGWNAGVVYEVDKNTRFGLDYHYSPEIKAKGTVQYGLAGTNYNEVILPLPSFAEFSGYHRFENSKFALHYSIQWIDWSVFKTLDARGSAVDGSDVTIKNYQWQDGWHYAIGGTYYLDTAWTLRAGYMYDTAAQDQVTSISVPDSDRQWFTAGLSYHFHEHHTVDFGIAYIMGEDTNVTEAGATGTLTAVTKADAVETGIQYSYSF